MSSQRNRTALFVSLLNPKLSAKRLDGQSTLLDDFADVAASLTLESLVVPKVFSTCGSHHS